eukprot:COSAG02_NODE_154_length_33067_cov_38.282092_17_plen_66_part_00
MGVKLPLVVARLCTQTIRAVEEVASEGEGEGGTGVSTGVGLVSSNALRGRRTQETVAGLPQLICE